MASSKQYNVYKGILDIPSYTQQLNKLNRLEADEIFKIFSQNITPMKISKNISQNMNNIYDAKIFTI